jgi:hypothetical protein
MSKKPKIPRKLSLVKFDFKNLPEECHDQYPFLPSSSYIFLGEIPNMKGHCIIGKKDGSITWGWHSDNFVELTDEEV